MRYRAEPEEPKLPSTQDMKTQGYYSDKVNVGDENPISSDAYLYFLKQTQGKKKKLDNPYAKAFKNALASKINSVKDKLDPIMNYHTGVYNEDDGESYLNGMPIDYRYMNTPSQKWADAIRKLLK